MGKIWENPKNMGNFWENSQEHGELLGNSQEYVEFLIMWGIFWNLWNFLGIWVI